MKNDWWNQNHTKFNYQLEHDTRHFWMNLFLEKINRATQMMPIANKRSDLVFTKTTNPKSARPKAINPNLSLDIHFPWFKQAFYIEDGRLIKTIPIIDSVLGGVDEPNPRHWQKLGLAASFPTWPGYPTHHAGRPIHFYFSLLECKTWQHWH